jgi:peptidoglycan lytic transglycosylase
MLKNVGRIVAFSTVVAGLLAGCANRPHPATPGAATTPKPIYKVGTPYQIGGVWYYPAEDFSYNESGIASWYGEEFHGKYTANGEVFDRNALTAAHRTLPMPSIVQVTNLENGRSLQLRVNDRGPFARGRIIDVSRRAAQLLGFEGTGTAKVRVRILVPESIQVASLARSSGTEDGASGGVVAAAPRPAITAEALPGSALRIASSTTPSLPRSEPSASAAAIAPSPSPQVSVLPVKPTHIYIQAGAFARAENALNVKSRLDAIGPAVVAAVRVNGVNLYRVRLGPVDNVEQADKLLERVVGSGLNDARIVVD